MPDLVATGLGRSPVQWPPAYLGRKTLQDLDLWLSNFEGGSAV